MVTNKKAFRKILIKHLLFIILATLFSCSVEKKIVHLKLEGTEMLNPLLLSKSGTGHKSLIDLEKATDTIVQINFSKTFKEMVTKGTSTSATTYAGMPAVQTSSYEKTYSSLYAQNSPFITLYEIGFKADSINKIIYDIEVSSKSANVVTNDLGKMLAEIFFGYIFSVIFKVNLLPAEVYQREAQNNYSFEYKGKICKLPIQK